MYFRKMLSNDQYAVHRWKKEQATPYDFDNQNVFVCDRSRSNTWKTQAVWLSRRTFGTQWPASRR